MPEATVSGPEWVVSVAVSALNERKAEDVVVLRMTDVLPITDYFVIATGKNARHVDALEELTHKRLKENGIRVQHVSGREGLTWVLLDCGAVVVHLFQPQTREYYDLELRWADAEKVPLDRLPQPVLAPPAGDPPPEATSAP